MGVAIKGNMKDLGVDGNVVYTDCINVTILVVILYNSFVRYFYWGKMSKGIFVYYRIS